MEKELVIDDALQRRINKTMQIVEEKHPEGLLAAQERMDQDLNMTCSDGGIRDKSVGYVKWTREQPDLQKHQTNFEQKHLKPSHEKMSLDHQSRVLGERTLKSREIKEPLEKQELSESDKLLKSKESKGVSKEDREVGVSSDLPKDDQTKVYMERTLDETQLEKEQEFDQQKSEQEGSETQTWGETLGQKAQQVTDQGLSAVSNIINVAKQTVGQQVAGGEVPAAQQNESAQEPQQEQAQTWGQVVGEKVQQMTDQGVALASRVVPSAVSNVPSSQEQDLGEQKTQPQTWTQTISEGVQSIKEKGMELASSALPARTVQETGENVPEEPREKGEDETQKGIDEENLDQSQEQQQPMQSWTQSIVGNVQAIAEKGKEYISGIVGSSEGDTEQLEEGAQQIREGAQDLVQQGKEKASQVSSDVQKSLQESQPSEQQTSVPLTQAVSDKVNELVEQGKDISSQVVSSVQSYVPDLSSAKDFPMLQKAKDVADTAATKLQQSLPNIPQPQQVGQAISQKASGVIEKGRQWSEQLKAESAQIQPGMPSLSPPSAPESSSKDQPLQKQATPLTESISQKAQDLVQQGKEKAGKLAGEAQAKASQLESAPPQIPQAQIQRIKDSQRHWRHRGKKNLSREVEGEHQPPQQQQDKPSEQLQQQEQQPLQQQELPQQQQPSLMTVEGISAKASDLIQKGKDVAGQVTSQVQSRLPELPSVSQLMPTSLLPSGPSDVPAQGQVQDQPEQSKGRKHRNRGKKSQSQEGAEPQPQAVHQQVAATAADKASQVKDVAMQAISDVKSQLPQDKPILPQTEESPEPSKRSRRRRNKKRQSQEGQEAPSEVAQDLAQKGSELVGQAKEVVQENLPESLQAQQQEQQQPSQESKGRRRRQRRRKSQQTEQQLPSQASVKETVDQVKDKGMEMAGQAVQSAKQRFPGISKNIQQSVQEAGDSMAPPSDVQENPEHMQTWTEAISSKVHDLAEAGASVISGMLPQLSGSSEPVDKAAGDLPEEDKQTQTIGEAIADTAQQLREKSVGLVSSILPASILPSPTEPIISTEISEQPVDVFDETPIQKELLVVPGRRVHRGRGGRRGRSHVHPSRQIITNISAQPVDVFDEEPILKEDLFISEDSLPLPLEDQDLSPEILADLPPNEPEEVFDGSEQPISLGEEVPASYETEVAEQPEQSQTWGEAIGGKVQLMTEKGKDLVGSVLQRAQNMVESSRAQQ